jgi:hypothetical protein
VAVDSSAVAEHMARLAAPGRGFDDLTPHPGGGRVRRHIDVHQLPPSVGDEHHDVEGGERECAVVPADFCTPTPHPYRTQYLLAGTRSPSVLGSTALGQLHLIVLVSAFDALGMPAVSQVLQQLLLWLPHLVVARVVLVLAGLAANALAGLVRGATSEAGLGGRETAGQIVASWYRSGQHAAPHMAKAAEAAQRQVEEPSPRQASAPQTSRERGNGAASGQTVVVVE